MWNWIKRKLGIKDYDEELLNLNTKVYETIKLLSDCLFELKGVELQIEELHKEVQELSSKVKAIPKEMVIKNVLTI